MSSDPAAANSKIPIFKKLRACIAPCRATLPGKTKSTTKIKPTGGWSSSNDDGAATAGVHGDAGGDVGGDGKDSGGSHAGIIAVALIIGAVAVAAAYLRASGFEFGSRHTRDGKGSNSLFMNPLSDPPTKCDY